MRKITIDFNSSEPCESKILGFIGEHNATELAIIPPREMTDNPQIKFFRLAFSVPYSVISSENLHIGLLKDSVIRWSVPDSVTKHERAALQLEGYGENGSLLVKSQTLHGLRFFESVNSENDFDTVNIPIKSGVEVTATDSDGNVTELIIYGNLPAGITVNGSKLEKITLHGMTEIPDSLCEGCTALREVAVCDTVTEIGSGSFKNCTVLESIALPESLKNIGASAFEGCAALKSVSLPSKIEAIGGKAFYKCTVLENIILPESLKSVGDDAFRNAGLAEITIPSSEIAWGICCFANSSVEKAVVNEGVTALPYGIFSGCKKLEKVILPSTLTSLGSYAFSGCAALVSVELPENLTSTGKYAFNNCTSLSSVSLNNIRTIGQASFYGCAALKTIALPESLTSIEDSAFLECGLSEISIPDSVTSIGPSAFRSCKNLSAVRLSKNINSLPKQIFSGTGLTGFEIPDNIENVGWYALASCKSLREVTIGSGVTYIDTNAFSSCYSLEYVRIKRTSPPTLAGYNAFPYSSASFIGIYVPKSEDGAVLNAYKTATNWKNSYLIDKIFEWEGEE